MRRRRLLKRLAVVLALVLLGSCRTVRFYGQAVRGQWEMLDRARPIERVAEDPATPDKLRARLALVQELREFARRDLDLPVTGQFSTYADLGRPFAVFNVYAAPEFSVEAKAWWYPFIGRAKYRGYFSEEPARREAEGLKRDGFDVFVGGVRVYSTLGWFDDPVLNTFVNDDPPALAETMFHELAHARVYLRGDSDFNEAFATAVGQEGARRWLRAKGDPAALRRYEAALERDRKLLALLEKTRTRLAELYARNAALDPAVRRAEKARSLEEARGEYEAMKRRGELDGQRDGWFGARLNNARLAALATYHDLVPGFRRLLDKEQGSLPALYEAAAAMKHLSPAERRRALLPSTGDAPASAH